MRICSLFPAATEMVCFLGLGESLVGVSDGCDWPPEVRGKPVVSASLLPARARGSAEIDGCVRETLASGRGIYHLNESLLRELSPDLILTQESCGVCAVPAAEVRRAASRLPGSAEVLVLDVRTLDGMFADLDRLARTTGTQRAAARRLQGLRRRIQAVSARVERAAFRPRVLCLEWLDPPMVAGHWIPELVGLAGGKAGFVRAGEASRRGSWEEILAYDPEVLLLVPCGFPLEQTLNELTNLRWPARWRRTTAALCGRVYAAEANAYFSRPGPRLVDTLELLAARLHPDCFPEDEGRGAAVPVFPETVGIGEEATGREALRADDDGPRALDRYLRETLGSVFRNMNSFRPGRRKPVKRVEVESYTRLYQEKRRLFLDS